MRAITPPDDDILGPILDSGQTVQPRPVFHAHLKTLLGESPDLPPRMTDFFSLLRLTGLLKRRYYQTSVLGKYLVASNLSSHSFIRFFQKEKTLAPLLGRHPTKKIGFSECSQLLVIMGRWYRQICRETGRRVLARDLRVFLEVLCCAFDLYDEKDTIAKEVWPQINVSLKREYRRTHLPPQQGSRRRYRPVTAPVPHKSFVIPEPRKMRRGLVLAKVLTDIYFWLVDLPQTPTGSGVEFELPVFDILKAARDAKVIIRDDEEPLSPDEEDSFEEEETKKRKKLHPIPVSQYTWTVTWIMETKLTDREKKFLAKPDHLQDIPDIGWNAEDTIKFLRKNLRIQFFQLQRGKKRRVLVVRPDCDPKYVRLAHQAKLERCTCGTCQYRSTYTKLDCIFFKKLQYLKKTGYTTIPGSLSPLYEERTGPIFSTKVACPFWAPKTLQPILLSPSATTHPDCIRCHTPLEALPTENTPVRCQCETQYSFRSHAAAQADIYDCQLSMNHHIGHDLSRIKPHLYAVAIQIFEQRLEVRLSPKQVFDPTRDDPTPLFARSADVVVVKEKSDIHYKGGVLTVDRRQYQAKKLNLIDTAKWNNWLQTLADEHPHLKFNCRFQTLTLSPKDEAHILSRGRGQLLHVTRGMGRQRRRETYPLQQLQAIYNVGKPRLTPLLEQWGIYVMNISTKGVSQSPKEEILAAISRKGAKQTLSTLHIQGLMISHMNAVWYLAELAYTTGQDWLGDQYLTWMNRRLPYCPTRLAALPRELELEWQKDLDDQSFQFVSRLEAWFSRPFAEGIRHLTRQLHSSSLFQRPYGRTVARRVKKRDKKGVDFMGGYTAYDAALNTIHRALRYRLRIWNAKMGLGFDTIPLYVHTTPDNPGRAGHLDLEEVGRIISRIALFEAIANGHIKPSQFRQRYDDNYLPYYVPSDQLVRWLRHSLVKKKILTTPLFYNNKRLPYWRAHQQHVAQLCACLEDSLVYQDETVRTKFLQETYNPLVFKPDLRFSGSSRSKTSFLLESYV